MCNKETERILIKAEKRIRGNFIQIKMKTFTTETKQTTAKLINYIKPIDEVLYTNLLNEYKLILSNA